LWLVIDYCEDGEELTQVAEASAAEGDDSRAPPYRMSPRVASRAGVGVVDTRRTSILYSYVILLSNFKKIKETKTKP